MYPRGRLAELRLARENASRRLSCTVVLALTSLSGGLLPGSMR